MAQEIIPVHHSFKGDSAMKEKLETELARLKAEQAKGNELLPIKENELRQLHQSMTAISGAILVIEKMLKEDEPKAA